MLFFILSMHLIEMEIIMSIKKDQMYTDEQKSKIVLELLKEEQTVSQIATKYKITSKSIQTWKKQFLENASLAFAIGSETKAYRDEIEELKEKNHGLVKALAKVKVKEECSEVKLNSLDFDNKKSLEDLCLQRLLAGIKKLY